MTVYSCLYSQGGNELTVRDMRYLGVFTSDDVDDQRNIGNDLGLHTRGKRGREALLSGDEIICSCLWLSDSESILWSMVV